MYSLTLTEITLQNLYSEGFGEPLNFDNRLNSEHQDDFGTHDANMAGIAPC